MADEITAPAEPASESFINPDGTYKEGWKEVLLPEDLRAEKFYDSPFNANIKELLKTAGNQAKALGKKGVIPLNDKSSDFEVQQWRQVHGVPDKYDYSKPTDLQMVEFEDEWLTGTLQNFNKANLSQGQMKLVMDTFHNYLKKIETDYDKSEQDEISKVNQQILMDENTAYEANSQLIDNAVRQFTQGWSEEDRLKLFGTAESKGGINSSDHIEIKPLLRKFLASVGKSMGEHRIIEGDLSGKSLQQQLDEVMKSPEYLSGYGKPHQDAVNKALKLREQLNLQQKK